MDGQLCKQTDSHSHSVTSQQDDELEATSSLCAVVKTLFDGNIMHPLRHSFHSVKHNKVERILRIFDWIYHPIGIF